MARIGASTSPPVEPPRALRPFLRFSRLPEQALVAMRRALDEDDDFRARVGILADEAELGRAGWLFVARPEGWEVEFFQLAEEAHVRTEAEREEREERSARRRLAHAEEASQRAEATAARARAEAAKLAAELAVERRERQIVQDEAARLVRRVTSLEGERDSARRRAEESAAEVERLQRDVEAEGARPAPSADRDQASGRIPDLAAATRAVAAASAASEALSGALEEASAALGVSPAGPGADQVDPFPPRPPSGSLWPDRQRPRGARRAGAPRRRPPALPPALLDDTVEAAGHLVRVPHALVLVDGYNAAKELWPDQSPIELRERLVDALSELEARTGAGIHVVFDGADLGSARPRPAVRRGVRVTFSPADVEADDVILGLVDAMPPEQPVVVASSDRRVQEGARERGAAVISSTQLAGVLGRA